MSKVTKKELVERSNEHEERIFKIEKALEQHGIKWTEEPKLKQLDQSVFDGLDEKWRFAAVDGDGEVWVYVHKPAAVPVSNNWTGANNPKFFGRGYDATNWKNSLIEREDIAAELLEVDLISELTGSDLCRAMLERGDKFVVCKLADTSEADAISNSAPKLVTEYDTYGFYHAIADLYWKYAVPINNQGEPLTASEVGL